MSKQCSYIKTDGSQCKAFAISNSNYCFFHVANGAGARFAGSVGGRKTMAAARRRRVQPDPVNVRCIEDILSLLEGSINEVRKGQVESRVANSVGYLANILIKAIEAGRVEQACPGPRAKRTPLRKPQRLHIRGGHHTIGAASHGAGTVPNQAAPMPR